jgi:hypothetical protein
MRALVLGRGSVSVILNEADILNREVVCEREVCLELGAGNNMLGNLHRPALRNEVIWDD